jgi:hypothetical protein
MFGGSHRSAVLLVATLSREGAGGMQILYDRCAGIDIGKDIIAVAVRVPGEGPDGRKTIKRTFKTFYGVLRECARWLTGHDVTHVARRPGSTRCRCITRCWPMARSRCWCAMPDM